MLAVDAGVRVFDSGMDLNLLQEFIMIPLDIFHKKMYNKPIETELEQLRKEK